MKGVFIPGMEMPNENDIIIFHLWHGKMYARTTANNGKKEYEVITQIEIPDSETVTSLLSVYDQEEIHENCTVHVLTNSQTGETSVGWWENEDE